MSVNRGEYADGAKNSFVLNDSGKELYSSYDNTYGFNKKTNGLRYFSKAGSNTAGESGYSSSFDVMADEAIVLIDPDFLFLGPFDLPGTQVTYKQPAAASYGLGDKWLSFNLTKICGIDSPCVTTTKNEVSKHYSVGPPYIIHVRDVPKFSQKWSELVPATYDEYPELYAEMFAYSMAAAHFNLKHERVNGIFTGCMMNWSRGEKALQSSAENFINDFDSSSEIVTQSHNGAQSCFDFKPPPLLHYCQRYPFRLNNGAWRVFAKRRVGHNILSCTSDPLLPWPEDGKADSAPGFERTTDEHWHALAVCAVVRGVAYAKKMGCASTEKH